MLPSQSGNEFARRSYAFDCADESRVGEARRQAQEFAAHLGFSDVRSTRLSIVINELATNLFRHASEGQLILRAADQFGERFVEVISVDRGPGLDISSFEDGVTSGSTPGTGLGAIRRQADLFDMLSDAGGTSLVCEIHATDESAQRALDSSFRVSGICLPIRGETVAGDAWTTITNNEGFEVIVVDGLGHGPVAHDAALAALASYAEMDPDARLDQKLQLLNGALRSTRGAAISIATLGPRQTAADVDFAGVGNVRGVICENGKDRTLLTRPGTVGLQFRPHPPSRTPWGGAGCFVMHSDGILSRWSHTGFQKELDHHPAILAATLFRSYSRGNDDLTVVVTRYGEGQQYT